MHMRELLTAAVRVGGVTHLVGPVTMVLQGGPRSAVSVPSYCAVWNGHRPFQRWFLGPNRRQGILLMASPKIEVVHDFVKDSAYSITEHKSVHLSFLNSTLFIKSLLY